MRRGISNVGTFSFTPYVPIQVSPVKRRMIELNLSETVPQLVEPDGSNNGAEFDDEFDHLLRNVDSGTTTLNTGSRNFHGLHTQGIENSQQDDLNTFGDFPHSGGYSNDDSFLLCDSGTTAVRGEGFIYDSNQTASKNKAIDKMDVVCEFCGENFTNPCPCDETLFKAAKYLDSGEDELTFSSRELLPITVVGSPISPPEEQEEEELRIDPLDTIIYPDVEPSLYSSTTYVREWIQNSMEFGISFYKLSTKGLQHPFVPQVFVHSIRDFIKIDERRFESPSTFFFSLTMDNYNTVMDTVLNLPCDPESGRELEHCRRAALALSCFYRYNSRRRKVKESRNTQEADMSSLPTSSKVSELFKNYPNLRSYQKDAVEFAISLHGKCILADEAGMGKRLEGFVVASYYRADWPLLIVCTSARIGQWKRELERQGIKSDRFLVLVAHQDAAIITPDEIDVVVVAYNALQNPDVFEQLETLMAKVLILDESHHIKNYTTKTTKKVRKLSQFAHRRIFLSANPMFGVPHELFQQLNLLDGIAFSDHLAFADQYCGLEMNDESGKVFSSKNWRNAKNLAELKLVLYGTVLIRHFRSEKFTLPKLEREKVYLEFRPNSRQRKLLGASAYGESSRTHALLEDRLEQCVKKRNDRHSAKIFTWYKRSGIAKLISICNYLDSVEFYREKVLIYARHVKVIEGIQMFLEQRLVEHVHIQGDYQAREALSAMFNCDPEIRVALLNLDLSNVSINLSAATLVIFAELNWVPDALFRNENRSYDLTAQAANVKRVIRVKYLFPKDESCSIDPFLWEMLLGKMEVLRKLDILRDPFLVAESEYTFTRSRSLEDDYPEFSDMSSDEDRDSDEYLPSDEEVSDVEHDVDTEEILQEIIDLHEDENDLTKSDWPKVFVTRLEHTEFHAYVTSCGPSLLYRHSIAESVDLRSDENVSENEEERDSDREFVDDRGVEDDLRMSMCSTTETIWDTGIQSEPDADDSEFDENESDFEDEVRKKAKGFLS